MINVGGARIDILGQIGSVSRNWAVFTVEFEYDSKLMVCHTLEWSVLDGIERLVRSIMSDKVEGLALRQSFVRSKYLTVEVKGTFENDPGAVMRAKYDLIADNKTYDPFGYNFLPLVKEPVEKAYALRLYRSLINAIRPDSPGQLTPAAPKRPGREPKPVYRYDRRTGSFVSGYASTKEAAQDVGISSTNICMCCNGHINFAAGFLWSYEKADTLEIPSRSKQRAKDAVEAAIRRQKMIATNINKD